MAGGVGSGHSFKRGLNALFERLTRDTIPDFAQDRATRGKARRDRVEEQMLVDVKTLKPLLPSLADGSAVEELYWAAERYFGFSGDPKTPPFERVRNACDKASASAAMAGFEALALLPPQVSPCELGIAEGEHRPLTFELCATAGVHRLLQSAHERLDAAPLTTALAVIGQSGALNMIGADEAENWAYRRLDQDPEAGAAAILDYWEGRLTKEGAGTSGVWGLAHENNIGRAATIAAERLLERHPALPHEALTIVLHGVGGRLERESLRRIALAALAEGALPERNRAIWNLVLFGIDGAAGRERLGTIPDALLEILLDNRLGDGLLGIVPPSSQAERAERDAAIIRLLGAKSMPGESHPRDGRALRRVHMSDNVQSALRALEANPDRSVGDLLAEALADDALVPWHDAIRHARAQHLRIVRDASFRPPSAKVVLAALDGKGPVNAMDLKAIVVDELRRLGRDLQSGPTNPWRDYWNTDRYGKPVDPKIENVARDITLTKLQERLKPYGIGAALPEGTRAHDTRADVLIMTGAGRNLPVEAKRHYHSDLWTAASTQLRGYAADPGADGHGVLLVFWFGVWRAAPTRKDKKKPTDAASLQRLLEADLDPGLAATTEVVVFDVSPPGEAPRAKAPRTKAKAEPRTKRLSKSATEAKSNGGGRKAGRR